jgi:hypothetical protein
MTCLRLVLMGIGIALGALSGLANADRYELGSRTIEVPAPTGFVAVSTRSAVAMSAVRESFPREVRVIEVYASPSELSALGSPPALDRFFSINMARSLQDFRVTEKQFSTLMDDLNTELAKDAVDKNAFYRREPWAVFYATGAILLPSYQESRHRYCTNAVARIDETPVHFMSCTLDRGAGDREWLRNAMHGWVKSVYDANPPRSNPPRTEKRIEPAAQPR